jgi:hypothetical protein
MYEYQKKHFASCDCELTWQQLAIVAKLVLAVLDQAGLCVPQSLPCLHSGHMQGASSTVLIRIGMRKRALFQPVCGDQGLGRR